MNKVFPERCQDPIFQNLDFGFIDPDAELPSLLCPSQFADCLRLQKGVARRRLGLRTWLVLSEIQGTVVRGQLALAGSPQGVKLEPTCHFRAGHQPCDVPDLMTLLVEM